MKTYVCIEGNIGVGKTTVIAALQELLPVASSAVVPEPVDEWVDRGFLQAMYNGTMHKGSFQLMVLSSLGGVVASAFQNPRTTLVVSERSIYSNFHVFATAALGDVTFPLTDGVAVACGIASVVLALVTECAFFWGVCAVLVWTRLAAVRREEREREQQYAVYRYTWENVTKMVPRDARTCFVYLEASTDELVERTRRRGRVSEGGLSSDYLSRLEMLHRTWLARETHPVAIVDATQPPDAVLRDVLAAILPWLEGNEEAEDAIRSQLSGGAAR